MLEGNTLEEVDLQPNDTVVAVIPSLKEEKEEKIPQAEVDGKFGCTQTHVAHVLFYCFIFPYQMKGGDVKSSPDRRK